MLILLLTRQPLQDLQANVCRSHISCQSPKHNKRTQLRVNNTRLICLFAWFFTDERSLSTTSIPLQANDQAFDDRFFTHSSKDARFYFHFLPPNWENNFIRGIDYLKNQCVVASTSRISSIFSVVRRSLIWQAVMLPRRKTNGRLYWTSTCQQL